MSGSVDLVIETGSDWGIQISWVDQNGNPYSFSDPVMNIRQALTPTSRLIAKLDTSGMFDGLLTIMSPGVLRATITADRTNTLPPGYGFWDLYCNLNGSRVRLLYGTIAIAAHVTELDND